MSQGRDKVVLTVSGKTGKTEPGAVEGRRRVLLKEEGEKIYPYCL